MLAKQSTAATIIIGPILDSAGAEYASAVIGDISISKNGGTLTALASAATLTYIANGQYTLVLTTGNTDTLGRAQFFCNKSTYQMPPIFLMVVPAAVFDALISDTPAVWFARIADICRRRTQANVEASADGDALSVGSEYGMIQQMQESSLVTHAGKQTVFKVDGTTELAQRDVTTDAAAVPITGIS